LARFAIRITYDGELAPVLAMIFVRLWRALPPVNVAQTPKNYHATRGALGELAADVRHPNSIAKHIAFDLSLAAVAIPPCVLLHPIPAASLGG
jgi:hypothetical protein